MASGSLGEITLTSLGPFICDPGTGRMSVAPGWGIRANGTAYFDPCGPQPGEAAWVRLDPTGGLHLEQPTTGSVQELDEGEWRPVALTDSATTPLQYGRPVELADPVTLPIRRPPEAITEPQREHLARQARRQRNALRIASNVRRRNG